MDALNLCWRGQAHSGKRTALLDALQTVAKNRGLPFSLQTKQFSTGSLKHDESQISTTAEDDGGDDGGSEKDTFPYEFSLVHVGFDIARMSMQDKIYLKPILQRWNAGSQVLAGSQGRASRILVFYHAHLLSTESYFLLHSVLESSFGDMSLWVTSELPIAERLADYFVEIPVAMRPGHETLPSWPALFRKLLLSWSSKPLPLLSETTEIRAFLYDLLMRNLRWSDCVHILLDVALEIPLEKKKQQTLLQILAEQEATAAGQTIPSYRIPLLWEALFLQIREALSNDELDGGTSSGSESSRTSSRITSQTAPPKVASRHSHKRGASAVQA
jgi:hypothetical protein